MTETFKGFASQLTDEEYIVMRSVKLADALIEELNKEKK